MKKDEPMRNINPFGLRMQPSLRAMTEEAAERNHRSLNAEIVARLEETFDIEDVLEEVAPGAPVTGTSGLLMDMHVQLKERYMDALTNTMAAYGNEIEGYIHSTDARLAAIEQQLKQIIALLKDRDPATTP